MQGGYIPTTPTCVDINIAAGEVEQVFFGVIPVGHECPPPIGACCFPDGSCVELDEETCVAQGGVYQGDLTLCDPNPCPAAVGACCFEDGSCAVMTEADCAAAGGIYQGDLTDCDPNPCPQRQGACCFPDGSCAVVTEADCAAAGGIYQGDGTDCAPGQCEPVPSVKSSWGDIKSRSR
jgi:hypothetical protein